MDYERNIEKYGGSLVLVLPSHIIKHLNCKEDDILVIRDENGKWGRYISVWLKNQTPAPPVPGDADYISESPSEVHDTTNKT